MCVCVSGFERRFGSGEGGWNEGLLREAKWKKLVKRGDDDGS